MSEMLIDERQSEILNIVNQRGFVSVGDLVNLVYASPATIRRDLATLENLGLVVKVRGGASSVSPSTGEQSVFARRQTNITEKNKIAKIADEYIKDQCNYFIDSSTTAGALVPYLKKKKGITVVTNSVDNALLLSAVGIKTYLSGGEVQIGSASTVGSDAIEYISGFHCDVFFFSCHGLTVDGPGEGTLETQKCKKEMLNHSDKHILLCDHSKIGVSMLSVVCPLEDIDVIITTVPLPLAYVKAFEEAGTEIRIAQ